MDSGGGPGVGIFLNHSVIFVECALFIIEYALGIVNVQLFAYSKKIKDNK